MKAYVYLITNLVNLKGYIGKTVDLEDRWATHKKVANGGPDKYPNDYFAIHGALNKYGVDNFKFEVLEEFDSEEMAYEFETWWIDYLGTYIRNWGYNLTFGGEGITKETMQKIRASSQLPEVKEKHSISMKKRYKETPQLLEDMSKRMLGNTLRKGAKLTEEHKQKCSDSLKGRVFTEEHKQKISQSLQGENCFHSKLTEINAINIINKWYSGKYTQARLADEYNVSRATINEIVVCKSWKYLPRPDIDNKKLKVLQKSNGIYYKSGINAKIKENDVIVIRELYSTGNYTQEELGAKYGITREAIGKIVKYQNWKYIGTK